MSHISCSFGLSVSLAFLKFVCLITDHFLFYFLGCTLYPSVCAVSARRFWCSLLHWHILRRISFLTKRLYCITECFLLLRTVHCMGEGFTNLTFERSVMRLSFLHWVGLHKSIASDLLTDIPHAFGSFWQDHFQRFTSSRNWYYYYSASNLIKNSYFQQ
jgi:hypothetical protein